MIFLPKIPYIHRIYMVLANPNFSRPVAMLQLDSIQHSHFSLLANAELQQGSVYNSTGLLSCSLVYCSMFRSIWRPSLLQIGCYASLWQHSHLNKKAEQGSCLLPVCSKWYRCLHKFLWYDFLHKSVVGWLPLKVCCGMTACISLLWYRCLYRFLVVSLPA